MKLIQEYCEKFLRIGRSPTASEFTSVGFFQLLYLIENYLYRVQDGGSLDYALLIQNEIFSV